MGQCQRPSPECASAFGRLAAGIDRRLQRPAWRGANACNRRRGHSAAVPASTGFAARRSWSTKFAMRVPRYTTRISEVPVVRAT
jgi:DNA polymerase V